jgi:hypothetical protein
MYATRINLDRAFRQERVRQRQNTDELFALLDVAQINQSVELVRDQMQPSLLTELQALD